jgi:hypothetical protein
MDRVVAGLEAGAGNENAMSPKKGFLLMRRLYDIKAYAELMALQERPE